MKKFLVCSHWIILTTGGAGIFLLLLCIFIETLTEAMIKNNTPAWILTVASMMLIYVMSCAGFYFIRFMAKHINFEEEF